MNANNHEIKVALGEGYGMKNQGKKARIESIVCDQGCGGSYCSLCGGGLDNGNPFNNPDLGTECPHCGAIFTVQNPPIISMGGSDF